jgi:hypothetical protein
MTERQRNDGRERWYCELNGGVEEGERELESEGRKCRSGWRSSEVYIGVMGVPGRRKWLVIGGVKALMPLMAGVVKEGGLAWGFKAGRVKAWRWHLKVSSGVAGMAKGSGI